MMKKAMLIIFVLGSLAATAQNRTSKNEKPSHELRENFTPEQKAELFSKKATLDLDLSNSQEKQIKQLFLELEKEKPAHSKTRKEMTSEDKYEFKKNRLDRRIAMKEGFKQILSPEQFSKWEASMKERKSHHKRGFQDFRQKKQ